MSRPLLQLALDHTSLQAAQRDVATLSDHVDIVEAGTILCLTEGLNAVRALRAQCPDKIIVADWKVADAGETLAEQAFGAGANWMTIICAAPLATVERGHEVALRGGGEIQMELFGNWTLDDARVAPHRGEAGDIPPRARRTGQRPAVGRGGSQQNEGAVRYRATAFHHWRYHPR